jgi:hypothetical protein
MLRFLVVYNISAAWIDRILVHMNTGGKSNNGITSRFVAITDNRVAWTVNNLSMPFFMLLLKRLRKLPQFLQANFYNFL